jgi:uncharacterized protein (DUF1501 family)
MKNFNDRRQFLTQASLLALGSSSAAAFSSSLQLTNALIKQDKDYKALVCIFLLGGNDAFNMLIPTDDSEYAIYKSTRQTLAIDKASLLPLAIADTKVPKLGLHPSMQEVQDLFNSGRLAFLTNVGALVEPVTRDTYNAKSVQLPPQLFSHNDQQSFIQSLQSSIKRTGWIGRAADVMGKMNQNQKLSMNISLSGSNLWQQGMRASPYSIDAAGIREIENLKTRSTDARELARVKLYQTLLSQSDNMFQAEYGRFHKTAWELSEELKSALDTQPAIQTIFPSDNSLADNLKMVAKIISARQTLNVKRQTFFVGMGDFDTHGDQLQRHSKLLKQLSSGLAAFNTALEELGLTNQVTTFTASDFGRTLTTNGDGTDHGWGGHQLIMGGTVKGKHVYGELPELILNGKDDAGEGRIIPRISMDQYSATLAQWFGLTGNSFGDVFPNLYRFDNPNLGFFK